uniref:C3H1-type domain-containing protein n=1 Tax=Setaria digitata TaxID=48799 RepID=A0A915PNR1_9BILA
MAPKGAPSKKADQKKKEKIIEDKTFGLKNKKGAKTQKYVQQVTNQIKHGNVNHAKIDAEKAAAKKKTADELLDLNKLLRPVTEMPKVARDVDPKSVVCLFYKQGMCHKGEKCKFSHDLSKEQKTAKKNLYVDSRDLSKEEDNIDEWDESKLSEVAEKKHGEHDRKRPNQTDIISCFACREHIFLNNLPPIPNQILSSHSIAACCRDFFFCRHALPQGYILKKDRKKLEEHKRLAEISLEDLIEKERAQLKPESLTKVTLETFISWKKKKLRERKRKIVEEEKEKRRNIKTGKSIGMSGRDLFTYNPELVGQDEGDMEGGIAFEPGCEEQENDESQIKAFEIDERTFYCIDDEGRMLDDDLDDDEKSVDATGDIENMQINEDLFNVDEIPDLESSEDEDNAVERIARMRIEEKNRLI